LDRPRLARCGFIGRPPGRGCRRNGQGWIRIGIGAASCELHVVLKRLPSSTDLVLGQCAAELLTAAVGDASDPQA